MPSVFDAPCFLCGGVTTTCSWDETNDKTGYRCSQCNADEMVSVAKKHPWWARILEKVNKKKKARLVLQEILEDKDD